MANDNGLSDVIKKLNFFIDSAIYLQKAFVVNNATIIKLEADLEIMAKSLTDYSATFHCPECKSSGHLDTHSYDCPFGDAWELAQKYGGTRLQKSL